MARKSANKTKNSEDISKRVDSLVEEIERTNNYRVIDESMLEEEKKTVKDEAKSKKADEVKSKAKTKTKSKDDSKKEKKDAKEKNEVLEESKNENAFEIEKDFIDENKETTEILENEVVDEIKKASLEDNSDSLEEKVEEVKTAEKEKVEEEETKVEDKKEEKQEEKTEELDIIDKSIEDSKKYPRFKNVEEEQEKNFDKTNLYELNFDENRLAETENLDTSFLQGRLKNNLSAKEEKKITRQKKKTLKSIDKDKVYKDETSSGGIKRVVIFCSLLLCLGAIIGFLFCYKYVKKIEYVEKEKIVEKEKKVVDENIVFLGDSITDFYDLEKYYKGYNVVNSGINGNTTQNILDNMEERVYRYNPSKVFILIGTNNFLSGMTNEEIVVEIEKIIDNIQENRPLAEIYVESVYPVNDGDYSKISHSMVHDRKNETIVELNKLIKKMATEKDLQYINMYDKLYDEEDGGLKVEYTTEGLHLSDAGYKIVTQELMKYIND